MTDAPTHAKVVGLLVAAYPTPGWEPPTIRLYRDMLGDIPLELLAEVVQEWIRTHTERPSVAEIRRLAVERQAKQSDNRIPSPDEAWGSVVRAITRVGSYGEPTDLHPLARWVVDAMGWRTLCMSDNQVADRAHFMRLYDAALERTMRESAASPGAVPRLPAPTTKEPERIGQDVKRALPPPAARPAEPREPVLLQLKRAWEKGLPPEPEEVGPPTIDDPVAIARREDRKRLLREQLEAIEKGAVH